MNNLTLKSILSREDIQKNIAGNLKMNSSELENAIAKTMASKKNNTISVRVSCNNNEADFENTFHTDTERNIYLLESRLFDTNTGAMIGAYLQVFDSNGTVCNDREIDDVWSYANWQTKD